MTFSQPFADYEILARVGSGAMGTVFKARQKKLDRIVALKVLKPALARDRHYVERLRREARIVAALNHPNIVAGHDLGQEGGYHYFVMEFVDGRSLKELLREWGSFPEEQVLDVAVQVAHALDHAWQKGVIHRDIKPGNILIDARGRVKLTDMGLAKGPEDLTLTREGATVGTPQYISPEQARDPQNVDIRSDLYSLGATLFHMATGSPPFQAESTGQLISKLLYDRAPSAAALNPSVSAGMSLVIRKLLAKEPTLRYQTPAELLADLGRVQRQEPLTINVDALERADRGAPPRRTLPVALLAGVVVALGGLAWWFLRQKPGPDPAEVRTALTTQLDDRLREAKGRLAGWRVLERAETAQSDPVLVQHVRALREGFEASWRGEIDALLTEKTVSVRGFLAEPAHWRDGSRFVPEVVEPALRERFGVAPAELPTAVRRHYEGRLQQFRFELDRLADERDAEHEASCAKHLETDLEEVLQEHLRGGSSSDFKAAEAALRTAIDGWHGQGGRPQRHELSEKLRARCEAREEKAGAEARRRIDDDEAAASRELSRELDDALTALRARLASDDPALVGKALATLERDLAGNYPPAGAFRGGADPWPTVTRRLREAQREVLAAVGQAERQRVDADLVACYSAVLAGGDASREVIWLDHLVVSDAEQKRRLARHASGVREAGMVLRRALEGALAGRASAAVPSARHPGGLRIERVGANFVVTRAPGAKPAAEPVRLAMYELPWPEWRDGLAAEAAKSASADERAAFERGLAFWLLAAGAGPKGLELVSEAERPFFANDVASVTQNALALLAKEDRPDAALAWRQLKSLFDEGNLDGVATALADFEARHAGSAVAASYQQGLKEIRSWVARQRRSQQVRRELAAGLPEGTQVDLLEDRTFRVECPGGALAGVRAGEGFRTEGGVALARGGADGSFVWRRLAVSSESSGTEVTACGATVRFPDAAGTPRVVAIELGGVAVVAQVLRNGAVATALVPLGVLQKAELVQKALQRPLEEAVLGPRAFVVTDANHELVLRVRSGSRRGTVVARAELDGVLVREEQIARPVGSAPQEAPGLRMSAGTALVRCFVTGRW